MDTVLVFLFLGVSGTLVLSDENVTRTARLEILRSPTKVAVWKPDPYPVLRSYGDDQFPASVKNQTSAGPPSKNGTEQNIEPAGSEDVPTSDLLQNNSTELANTTLPEVAERNSTCIRRDYEDNVAAIFHKAAGPIDTADVVFNSTVDHIEGAIYNTTQLTDLKVLNETSVDCQEYTGSYGQVTYSLSIGAVASLAGRK